MPVTDTFAIELPEILPNKALDTTATLAGPPLNFPAIRRAISVESDAASAIARESEGDLRRAINLLQITATSNPSVTEDDVYNHSETTLNRTTREIVSLTIDGSYQDARKMMRSLVAVDGYDPQEVLLAIKLDL